MEYTLRTKKALSLRLRAIIACLFVVCWLSAPTMALAQAFPPLDGIVADDTGLLNAAEVNQAAVELEQLGIRPLVVFSQTGLGYLGSEQLAYAAVENYGLAQPGRILDPNLLAIVVVLDKRQATILYGDNLKPELGSPSGPSLADELRDKYLNPNLAISMSANGYSTGGAERAFFRNPDTQLNAWSQPPDNSAHYGASYLFLRYLMDRYGGERFISTMLKQRGLSTQAIDATVRKAGNTGGFDAAFKDWTVANVLNDRTLASGRYSYSQGGQAQVTRTLQRYPATRTEPAHQYAADYIKLSGNLGKAKITFKGNSTVSVIGIQPHGGQAFWYSNRRDSGDATLTREVDLTQLRKATLQFWTWYDIEDYFDLAYAEVSMDVGKSWATLKGKYTTTDNPNGTSFGNGWTGKSGSGSKGTGPARWVEERLDLSPYAGKKVLLRFEYVTDEGYNAPGFAIDDIRIPELGFIDGAEIDTGWNAQGFVRIGGRVPQKWFVALIEKGKTNRVREMVVTAAGIGTLDLTGLGPSKTVREAILVVAPLAPKTTEITTYTVTVR